MLLASCAAVEAWCSNWGCVLCWQLHSCSVADVRMRCSHEEGIWARCCPEVALGDVCVV